MAPIKEQAIDKYPYIQYMGRFDEMVESFSGITNKRYSSKRGFVKYLSVDGKSEVQNDSIVSIESVTVGGTTIETPLRSAGSAHDKLVVQDTNVKKIVRISEIVFDGSENGWIEWNSSSVHADNKYYYRNVPLIGVDRTLGNQFINSWGFDYNSDYASAVTNEGHFYLDASNEPCFIVKKADYPTLDDFKTALAANPLIINYILQSSTEQSLLDIARIEISNSFEVKTEIDTTFKMISGAV